MNLKQLGLFFKKFRYEITAIIITAYGMYLRFMCLAHRELWADEIATLQAYTGAFKPVWQRQHLVDLSFFQGDYIISWPFVSLFKDNKWGLAIPHILFTLLGFYFLYLICKRYFHSIFAWVATFSLVAIHRDLIFHSFELRPYAVLPTLALAVFYFTEQVLSSRYHLSLIRKVLIGLFYLFTIVYHCYGAVILFCTFVYFLLCESGERTFGEIFKLNYRFIGSIVLIGLPLFLWYALYNDFVINGFGSELFYYIPDPLVNLFGFIKVILCCLAGNKILYFLAISLTFPFLLPYRDRLRQIGFMLILIILPIMTVFSFTIFAGYTFVPRQFIWAMPLFAFLVGWCFDSFAIFIKQGRRSYA